MTGHRGPSFLPSPTPAADEVAGQAEFCFTSIHQRVCRWPLRARLHYGHPDLMDGYWVRTRGGLSHASHMVNTAEDVFAGYEVVGRGERVEYIEWLQVRLALAEAE